MFKGSYSVFGQKTMSGQALRARRQWISRMCVAIVRYDYDGLQNGLVEAKEQNLPIGDKEMRKVFKRAVTFYNTELRDSTPEEIHIAFSIVCLLVTLVPEFGEIEVCSLIQECLLSDTMKSTLAFKAGEDLRINDGAFRGIRLILQHGVYHGTMDLCDEEKFPQTNVPTQILNMIVFCSENRKYLKESAITCMNDLKIDDSDDDIRKYTCTAIVTLLNSPFTLSRTASLAIRKCLRLHGHMFEKIDKLEVPNICKSIIKMEDIEWTGYPALN